MLVRFGWYSETVSFHHHLVTPCASFMVMFPEVVAFDDVFFNDFQVMVLEMTYFEDRNL